MRMLQAAAGLFAAIAIAAGGVKLLAAQDGLQVQRVDVDGMPVTVMRPAHGAPGSSASAASAGAGAVDSPVVVIAHGFAGSQQLMQPFATTLARSGYTTVSFDFPGHGRHPAAMPGGLADQERSLRALLDSMASISTFARGLGPPGAGHAVLGHSMASDIVVRHAQAHPDIRATVAVSLFAPSIGPSTAPDSPRNLLVIDGALEPSMMATEALRVVGRTAGDGARAGETYGRFADGTARRAVLSPGVEHIGVLYSPVTQRETLDWLNEAFGRTAAARPFIDARGPWLGLLLAGIVGLAWPLSSLLPRIAGTRAGDAPGAANDPAPRMRWRRFWPLAVLPAVATPLLLWKLHGDFLPILLGSDLLAHFLVYGLLTAALLAWHRRRNVTGAALRGFGPVLARRRGTVALATVAVTAFGALAIGAPIDRFVFNLQPVPVRLPVIVAMICGTLPWFLADEWLTRDPAAPRGAYFVTKLCFLLSLVLAIALNPHRLFFLAIIVPAILLLFVVYGLVSRWAFRRTGHPVPGAVANGLIFGWFIGVVFPLVS